MKVLNRLTGEWENLILRAPGNYDTDLVSQESGLACKDVSLTRQSEAADADINEIVRRFGLTGQLPTMQLPPSIAAFDEVFDFQDAMNIVAAAQQAFMALPAEARNHFANDPHRFVNTVDDAYHAPDEAIRKLRTAELEALGLKLPPAPTAAPAAPTAPTEPPKT